MSLVLAPLRAVLWSRARPHLGLRDRELEHLRPTCALRRLPPRATLSPGVGGALRTPPVTEPA
jgi:hypothetical protein